MTAWDQVVAMVCRRLNQNGDPQAALEWFDKAQAKLEEVRKRAGGDARARAFLRNTHWNRAEALVKLDRHAEALREWDQALELDVLDIDRAYSRLGRALALVRLGKCDQAVAIAEDQVGRPEADVFGIYRAARVFSLASVVVGQDTQREAAERQQLTEQYAARAVALLRRTQSQAIFKDPGMVADLKQNADLDGLRSYCQILWMTA
jgi:tetratricopeptide (TPR) repeat protein